MILPEVVHLAKQKLGAKCSAIYGLTEGGPVMSWRHDEVPDTFPDGYVSPGHPVPGGLIRICAPGSRIPLKRGEAGEIHQGSTQLIPGYLGGFKQEEFYDDRLGHWNISGDQGILLANGELRVSGRYKDIIIRGGENIAPAQVEAVLNIKKGIDVSSHCF